MHEEQSYKEDDIRVDKVRKIGFIRAIQNSVSGKSSKNIVFQDESSQIARFPTPLRQQELINSFRNEINTGGYELPISSRRFA